MVEKSLQEVRNRIAAAARSAGRDPASVRLICVTKGVSADVIRQAAGLGVQEIGENRVQEADEKQRLLGHDLKWHMIGHLQRNKVKEALEIFDVIHSVDRLELAETIQRAAEQMQRKVEVLLQVNAAKIDTRYGAAPEEVPALVEKLRLLDRLKVTGLMAMAPYADAPETVRPVFRQVRELAAQSGLKELSMGMSNDFEVAVQEGATMVRIGTAIFR
jgi:pyridoxal phosphate enzyme (YggS family)